MKRGRPKKTDSSLNRRHTIIFNEKAEIIFRKVCKERGTKWLHEYVSEHIVRDFEMNPKAFLLRKLQSKQQERDELEEQIWEIAQEIKAIEREKIKQVAMEEFQRVGLR